jgi:hypothetical protein
MVRDDRIWGEMSGQNIGIDDDSVRRYSPKYPGVDASTHPKQVAGRDVLLQDGEGAASLVFTIPLVPGCEVLEPEYVMRRKIVGRLHGLT